ncbi:MAG: S24 family peptidase [Pseudomonadota bacterium]
MASRLKENARARRDELGITNAEVTRRGGFKRTFVYDFFKEEDPKPKTDNLQKLADALETTVAHLTGETDRASVPSTARTLPVMGQAAGSIVGAQAMPDEPIAYHTVPAGLIGVRDAYALEIGGNSMFPAYKDRDKVYVAPHQPVRTGDVVIIQEERDGDVFASIKVFVKNEDDHILTEQYNPLGEVKFSRKYVIAVHRVLPWNEVIGQ